MSGYLEQQNLLVSRQKSGLILFFGGGLAGFIFLPLLIVCLAGLCLYWLNVWKVFTSKCPNCGENVGLVRQFVNESCRGCGTVFIEPFEGERGVNQDKWLQ
jgi:hypothetical protein